MLLVCNYDREWVGVKHGFDGIVCGKRIVKCVGRLAGVWRCDRKRSERGSFDRSNVFATCDVSDIVRMLKFVCILSKLVSANVVNVGFVGFNVVYCKGDFVPCDKLDDFGVGFFEICTSADRRALKLCEDEF